MITGDVNWLKNYNTIIITILLWWISISFYLWLSYIELWYQVDVHT